MKTWLALIVAPAIALAAQGIMYSLVTPSCSTQTRVWIHVAAALALAAVALLGMLAWGEGHSRAVDPADTRSFLSVVAAGVAAIAALMVVCMWLGVWMLSPCYPV